MVLPGAGRTAPVRQHELVGLHIRINAETTASLAAAGIYRPPGRRLAAGALQ